MKATVTIQIIQWEFRHPIVLLDVVISIPLEKYIEELVPTIIFKAIEQLFK